jgi:proteasome lid subunit RPN8/RPN11
MADRPVIRIAAPALDAVRAAARAGYPEECCGFLFGQPGGNGAPRDVQRAVAADNGSEANRARRYAIGPDAVRNAERAAAAAGLEVVGFYHSHPDHPAEPSRFDLEHAWPWYTYLIVPVHAGEPGAPRAWHLDDDRSRFDAAEILEDGR